MTEFGDGFESERNGEYRQAAAHYATHAFRTLIDEEFTPTRRSRIGIATLLLSISCDVRAGTEDRPQALKGIIEFVAHRMKAATDDPVLDALMTEWIGDAHLMLGETDSARIHYNAAREAYVPIRSTDEWLSSFLGWGSEEEFSCAFSAFTGYVEYIGGDITWDDTLEFEFVDRIDAKLVIISEYNEE